MMELINAPGWARNVYPVTYLSGNTQDCADLHSFGPGMRKFISCTMSWRGRGVFEENGRAYPVETGAPSWCGPGHYPLRPRPRRSLGIHLGGLLRQRGRPPS